MTEVLIGWGRSKSNLSPGVPGFKTLLSVMLGDGDG